MSQLPEKVAIGDALVYRRLLRSKTVCAAKFIKINFFNNLIAFAIDLESRPKAKSIKLFFESNFS